jgi:hypothetical protein
LKRAKRGESDGLVNLFAQLLAFHLKVPSASSKNCPHFTLWLPDNPSRKKMATQTSGLFNGEFTTAAEI